MNHHYALVRDRLPTAREAIAAAIDNAARCAEIPREQVQLAEAAELSEPYAWRISYEVGADVTIPYIVQLTGTGWRTLSDYRDSLGIPDPGPNEEFPPDPSN